jgi:iron(III) transport system ATP-binding protein
MTAVHMENVARAFAGKRAVDDVSLNAPAGAVTVLLGASGSGKSTLLRIVAGLEPVDMGRVTIGGKLVSQRGATLPAEKRGVGMVFQDYALFPHMTAAQNVAFGVADKAQRADVAHTWLTRMGLAARAGAYPHELSGGEQQRVAIARAIAPRPQVLLFDEPFSGLDPALRVELREVAIAAVRELGATTLFVTHDADEALAIADCIAILRDGALVQAGAPREVYAHPASPEAAAALGPVNVLRGAVSVGVFATPFGPIPTSCRDGPATAVVRAEAIQLAQGAGAQVIERRPQGALDLVRVRAGDVEWRALVPALHGPDVGEHAAVAFEPRGVFVFSASRR